MAALGDAFRRFDPEGLMNPGKLLPSGGSDVPPGERDDPDGGQRD